MFNRYMNKRHHSSPDNGSGEGCGNVDCEYRDRCDRTGENCLYLCVPLISAGHSKQFDFVLETPFVFHRASNFSLIPGSAHFLLLQGLKSQLL